MEITENSALALELLDTVLAGQQASPPLTDAMIHERLTGRLHERLDEVYDEVDTVLATWPDTTQDFKDFKGRVLNAIKNFEA